MKRIFSLLTLILILTLTLPFQTFASEWETLGDITGPASSTDNTIPRYDGTTGKLLQGSLVTIDDSNNMTIPAADTDIHVFTDASWNDDDATWTMTGTGPLVHVTGNATAVTATNTEAIVVGTTYKVTITGTGGTATATYTLGGVTGTTIAASGAIAITDYITASTTASMIITPANTCTVSISSITIKKLTDATGDLTVEGNLKVGSPIQNIKGQDVITLGPTGNVGIGVTPETKLDIADDSIDAVFRIRHSNLSQGISIGYNTILANGTGTNLDINVTSKGTGAVKLSKTAMSNSAVPCAATVCTDVPASYAIYLTTTGTDTMTLADGTNAGQEKYISHKVDGGQVTITPTNFSGGTNVVLTAAGDNAKFHWNGTKWDILSTTGGYDTIYVDAAAMIPSTTSGALQGTKEYGTNDIDIDYFAFDAGATEERVQFKLKMPETWDLGTVKVKFDWTSDTGSTAGDTVEWGIKAGALSNDDAIDAALGTAQVITDTLLANNGTDLQITAATPAITIGGTPALGDVIVFEVYRNTDGTDDMAEDAWLTGITIQYSLAGVPAAW